jgi:hypothetical protein
MVTLKDGRALLTGGLFQQKGSQYASLYDPATNGWSAGASMPGTGAVFASSDCGPAKPTPGCDIVAIQNKVCLSSPGCCSTAWTEACVDAIGQGVTGTTCGRHDGHDMLVLDSGRVLLAMGNYTYPGGKDNPLTPLVYTPTPGGPGSWDITTDPSIDAHSLGALAPIPDGNALLAGGNFDGTSHESCFQQGCACNQDFECNTNHCVDGICCDTGRRVWPDRGQYRSRERVRGIGAGVVRHRRLLRRSGRVSAVHEWNQVRSLFVHRHGERESSRHVRRRGCVCFQRFRSLSRWVRVHGRRLPDELCHRERLPGALPVRERLLQAPTQRTTLRERCGVR